MKEQRCLSCDYQSESQDLMQHMQHEDHLNIDLSLAFWKDQQ
jgi:hypothetical protein